MAHMVKYGKHKVAIEFHPSGAVVAMLGDAVHTVAEANPDAIAAAVQTVVAKVTAIEQVEIAQKRLIEDTKRALGQ